MQKVIVTGGAGFIGSNLVDELIIYQSNNILGSNGVAWFTEDNAIENLGFKLESTCKIKADTKRIYTKC